MDTLEELKLVSRIEGGYEHLATKADLYKAILQLAILQTTIVGAGVAFLKLTGN